MTEAEKLAQAKAAEDQAKADAAARADAEPPAWAKNIADAVGACMSRMDAMESLIKCDAEERAKADKARKDAEEEEKAKADKARKDAEEDEAKADKARKDAEEEAAKADAARADSVAKAVEQATAPLRQQIAALSGAVHISDADAAELARIQARADEVALEFGKQAARPMAGETPVAYRRRLAAQYQPHSKQWKDVDLGGIADSALHIAEEAIYADAVAVASTQPDIPAGTLREIKRKDRTGREVIEFQGSMNAWMGQFKAPGMKQVKIFNGSN
jgi:flagellar motor protein MotB